ncbi:MAG: ATP-binding protein [Pseudomonadota bacterium]
MDLPAHLLTGLTTPVWVVDASVERLVWANHAAYRLWDLDPETTALPIRLDTVFVAGEHQRFSSVLRDPTRLSKRLNVTWLGPARAGALTIASVEEFEADSRKSFFIITENVNETMQHDVFNGMPESTRLKVSTFSVDGQFIECNHAAELFFGMGGHRFERHFSEGEEAEVVLAELRQDGVSERITRGGSAGTGTVWHKLVATLEEDASSGDTVVVLRETDITEVMQTLTELKDERDAAVAASDRKTHFLAVMSHEIRTPMTGVLGLSEILHSRIEEPSLKSLAATLQEAGKALLHVTDQVLDLTRIESGRLDLNDAELRPFDFIEPIEKMYASTVAMKSLAFEVLAGEGTNIPRIGDRHRILQIAHNLLSNAIKFTEKGRIELRLEAPANGPLTMTVSDTGVGLTGEEQARLFQPFTQASPAIEREFGGSGLGLYIVNDLVTQMKGTVSLESAPGVGTTVTITLPLPVVENASEQERAPEDAAAFVTPGLKALIVDDNGVNRQVLQLILQSLDLEVVAAASAEEALMAHGTRDFDLVMLDIAMPGMPGTVLMQRLREIEAGFGRAPSRMISVTAHTMEHEVRAYREMGFDAHVAKPLKIEAIKEVIGAFFGEGGPGRGDRAATDGASEIRNRIG